MKEFAFFKNSQYYGLPKTIYILAIGKMINCIGAFINPLLSLILIQKIGLSVQAAGFYVTFALAIQTPFIILGGKLVDSIGPKKVIVCFQSLAASIFIVCAFVPTNHILICLLVAQSCCSALTTSCFDAIVGNITTDSNRKASFSLIYMGLNLGFAIGPGLGALLFENYLSLLFIGDGLTALICAILIAVYVRDDEYSSVSFTRPSLEQKADGSVFQVLLERPVILVFALTMLLLRFVSAQFNFTVPIQVNGIFGNIDGPIFFGLLCSLNGFIVITFTPIVSAFTKKCKPTNVMAVGALLYSVFYGLCGFSYSKWHFVLIIICITIGEVSIAINQGVFVASLTPASHRGRILSIIPILTGIGYCISSSIMGFLITNLGIKISWFIVGAIGIVATILMYCLKYIAIKNKKENI